MIIPGVIAASHQASGGMTELVAGANAFNYTGAKVLRVVPAGVKSLRLKVWGAGGGGGTYSKSGGPGGWVYQTVEVDPGDVLLIQVGGGGGPSLPTAPRTGGLGGWPDGGDGGVSPSYVGGAGGGSSRVWRNGVPVAVAAGGGGGGNQSGGNGVGAGGGRMGSLPNVGIYIPAGGTQTHGGYDNDAAMAVNPNMRGAYLQAGRGYTGASRFVAGVNAGTGGGGGGGWYGGAGGGGGSGGSGGSSWFNQTQSLERLNTTTMGATASPGANIRSPAPANTDPNYPAGDVATGGATSFSATPAVITAGGHGYVWIETVADAPQPVRVTQHHAEVLSLPTAPVRVTQHHVEVAYTNAGPVRTTQQSAEILHTRAAPVRVTHQTVEIIRSVT